MAPSYCRSHPRPRSRDRRHDDEPLGVGAKCLREPQSGSRPSRISATAGMLAPGPLQVSSGSYLAPCAAYAFGCRHEYRWGLGLWFWPCLSLQAHAGIRALSPPLSRMPVSASPELHRESTASLRCAAQPAWYFIGVGCGIWAAPLHEEEPLSPARRRGFFLRAARPVQPSPRRPVDAVGLPVSLGDALVGIPRFRGLPAGKPTLPISRMPRRQSARPLTGTVRSPGFVERAFAPRNQFRGSTFSRQVCRWSSAH
jgi:hypothetical protein